MRFHSLQFQIKGCAEGFLTSDGQELDIADEFSYLSRSLGFERGVLFLRVSSRMLVNYKKYRSQRDCGD